MIQPFLDENGARSQPHSMDIRDAEVGRAVRMAVAVANVLKNVVRSFGVEVAVQADCALPAHVEATDQQHA